MPADVVLQTWKEISEYVGRTERTVQRWEQQFGLPVHRPSGKPRSSVMALAQEIQEWTRGKPSLVAIRRTARLSRQKLFPNASDVRNSRNEEKQSLLTETTRSYVEPLKGKELQRVTWERISLARSLWEEQMNLRADVGKLIREQRSLCATIRRNRMQCRSL